MLTELEVLDRRNHLGGSDLPIILGLSNFKSCYQLYLEKVGLLAPDFEQTEQQRWGHLLEPVLRAEFEARHGLLVPELKNRTHQEIPFIKGNLDGYNEERNIVWEAKTSSSFMSHVWGESGSDIIPPQYLVQIATYCSIVGASQAYLSVLIGGNEEREFIYNRDLELEKMILDAAKNFWECVQSRKEPEPTTLDDFKLKYKTTDPSKKVAANDDVLMSYAKLGGYKQEAKYIAEQEAKAKMEIMAFMADAEVLTDIHGDQLASWKADKHGTRRFRIKEI